MRAASATNSSSPLNRHCDIVAASEDSHDRELARRLRASAGGLEDADCAGSSRPMLIRGLAWLVLGCALWMACVASIA